MRGQGRVFRPKKNGQESDVWWLDYGVRGVRYRESSGTTSKKEAHAKLRALIGKRTDGTLTGRPERVTLGDLRTGLERRYEIMGNNSWTRAAQAFAHLEAFFGGAGAASDRRRVRSRDRQAAADALRKARERGATTRVIDITKWRVTEYQTARMKAGASRNSVRYEVGILDAAFGVAVKDDLIAAKPAFSRPTAGAARSGFFEPADFAALILCLPGELAAVARFAYMTGWRSGEVRGLLWSQVEWDDSGFPGEHEEPTPGPNACIRIGVEQTKGGDSRVFPLAGAPELCDLLLARWQERDGLHVFHRKGKPVGDFRKVWKRACKTAGVPGRLFHDLRRTAGRDFRRAGVSEGVIMRLCGWKTRAMFDRYNIVDAEDLSRGVARRFSDNGKETARNDAPVGASA